MLNWAKCTSARKGQEVHYWHTGQDVSRRSPTSTICTILHYKEKPYLYIYTKRNHEKPIKITPPNVPTTRWRVRPWFSTKKVTREIEVLTIATQNQSVSGTSQSCFQQNWDIPEVGYTSQHQKWEIISPKCQWHPSNTKTSEFVISIYWPTEMDLR